MRFTGRLVVRPTGVWQAALAAARTSQSTAAAIALTEEPEQLLVNLLGGDPWMSTTGRPDPWSS